MRAITLPTPGNHEWGNRAVGYDPYWSQVTGGTPPPYYAVSLAGWRLVSANSETDHGSASAQVRWLRGQMARPGTCKIVFWHRPRFSAGLHGDEPDIAPLWDATLGHASLVLNGHDHDMQRMRPVRGVTELVSGAGGHILYPVDTGHPRLAWSHDRDYGALRLDLRPGSARWTFVSSLGRTLDSGTIRCRSADEDGGMSIRAGPARRRDDGPRSGPPTERTRPMAKYAILIYEDEAGYAAGGPELYGKVLQDHRAFAEKAGRRDRRRRGPPADVHGHLDPRRTARATSP